MAAPSPLRQGNRHVPTLCPGRRADAGLFRRTGRGFSGPRHHDDRSRRGGRQCRHHGPPGRAGNEQATGPARGHREPRRRRRADRHPGRGARRCRRLHHRLCPRRHPRPAPLPVQGADVRHRQGPRADRAGGGNAQRHRGQPGLALPDPAGPDRRKQGAARPDHHDLGRSGHHQRSGREAVHRADGRGGAPDSVQGDRGATGRPAGRACRLHDGEPAAADRQSQGWPLAGAGGHHAQARGLQPGRADGGRTGLPRLRTRRLERPGRPGRHAARGAGAAQPGPQCGAGRAGGIRGTAQPFAGTPGRPTHDPHQPGGSFMCRGHQPLGVPAGNGAGAAHRGRPCC